MIALLMLLSTAAWAQEGPYNEAPQLSQLVEAGQLPPVEERLPVNPLVVPVVERIGDYGGTWRTALVGGADQWWLARTIGYENLMRWSPDGSQIIPNIAESYEANEDATEFIFHLREGMKWSDGHPFTADDILFWYEDVYMNDDLTPAKHPWMVAGDEPGVVEKIDDYTVEFTFSAPNGLFLLQTATILGGGAGGEIVAYPKHYLQQFHPRYNSEGLDALVREADVADWIALFQLRGGSVFEVWRNADRPVLHAWQVSSSYGDATTRLVAERNPYYFKVDPEGNQLPYIDRVTYDLLGDPEVLLLRALAGEIDLQDRHIATNQNKPLFIDNMERGDYRLFSSTSTYMNTTVIYFNLTNADPVKREIFNNKDFRIGLSHAINRQEIIDLVYTGQGEPYQAAPRPESELYHEQLARQYTEYDPDLANEYLDSAFPERDAQGFRLGPDGNRISFIVDITDNRGQNWADQFELIQQYWHDVGIDMQYRVIDGSLRSERQTSNQHEVGVWVGDGGMIDAIIDPRYYFPYGNSVFAILWENWYRGSSPSEEPSPAARRQMELYDQLISVAASEEQVALFQQILDIAAEEFWVIGINLWPEEYGIVKNNFRNVPETMPSGGLFVSPANTNPSQYFIEATR